MATGWSCCRSGDRCRGILAIWRMRRLSGYGSCCTQKEAQSRFGADSDGSATHLLEYLNEHVDALADRIRRSRVTTPM